MRRYLDLLTGVHMVRQLQPWHENLGKRQGASRRGRRYGIDLRNPPTRSVKLPRPPSAWRSDRYATNPAPPRVEATTWRDFLLAGPLGAPTTPPA